MTAWRASVVPSTRFSQVGAREWIGWDLPISNGVDPRQSYRRHGPIRPARASRRRETDDDPVDLLNTCDVVRRGRMGVDGAGDASQRRTEYRRFGKALRSLTFATISIRVGVGKARARGGAKLLVGPHR